MMRRMLFVLLGLAIAVAIALPDTQPALAEQNRTVTNTGIVWEPLTSVRTDTGFEGTVYRTAVPGGWLIDYEGVAFIPDPEHKWNGSSLNLQKR